MASAVYSEQVGVNRHEGGNSGEISRWYKRIRKMKIVRKANYQGKLLLERFLGDPFREMMSDKVQIIENHLPLHFNERFRNSKHDE